MISFTPPLGAMFSRPKVFKYYRQYCKYTGLDEIRCIGTYDEADNDDDEN